MTNTREYHLGAIAALNWFNLYLIDSPRLTGVIDSRVKEHRAALAAMPEEQTELDPAETAADKLFKALFVWERKATQFSDEVKKILGQRAVWSDITINPWKRSFTLHNFTYDYLMPRASAESLFALGFDRFKTVHEDVTVQYLQTDTGPQRRFINEDETTEWKDLP